MDRNEPIIVIEGIDVIIKRDLEKHQDLLERSKLEKQAYVTGRAHEIKRKKNWRSHMGGGKFNDAALTTAIEQINQNIAMYSAKVKLSDDAIAHHGLIVETLAVQLEAYHANMVLLAKSRGNGNGHSD